MGLAAAERTLCATDAEGRTTCAGAASLPPTTLVGALEVSDAGVCARTAGEVRCRSRIADRTFPTPFVEVLRGPGFPCTRDADGGVWCFAGPAEDEASAALVPVALPGPARRLGGDGTRLYAWLADGRVVAFRSPAHGGGRAEVVASGVTAFASDGWTEACWLRGEALACAGRGSLPGPWPAERLGVGRAAVCASGPGATRCEGLAGELPGGVGLAVGADFACVISADGQIRCLGPAPELPDRHPAACRGCAPADPPR